MNNWIWFILWGFSIIIFIFLICDDKLKKLRRLDTSISFKEGFDLTELPIVTFNCNDKKLHFLLDTGSNVSYINLEVLSEVPHKEVNKKSEVIGIEGNAAKINHYLIKIGYKDNLFEEEFGAVDLSSAFQAINKESGVKLHGILGSKFFEKYKYILDFSDLTAYK